MADEQQEMSVNDILSSIKNILVENENPSAKPSIQVQDDTFEDEDILDLGKSDITIADLPLDEKDEDVFNLAPEMRMDAETQSPFGIDLRNEPEKNETSILDLDAELAEIKLNPEIIDDKGDDEIIAEVENEPSLDDLISDSTPPTVEEIDIESEPYYGEPQENNTIATDEISALISEPEELLELDLPQHVNAIEAPVPASRIETPDEITPVFESPVEAEIIAKPQDQTVNEAELQVVTKEEPQDKIVAPATIPNTPVESADEDSTDVSAGIISNFAKIFAQNQESNFSQTIEKPTEIKTVKENIQIGHAGLTLEDMVKEAIKSLVADWVNDIHDSINVKEIAANEVAAQTKIWLDANLPTMVEAIVKKEIERVMVKVGR